MNHQDEKSLFDEINDEINIVMNSKASDFFKNIIHLCRLKCLSLSDIRNELHISDVLLDAWVVGNGTDKRKIAPIAKRLGVTVEELRACEPLLSHTRKMDEKIKKLFKDNTNGNSNDGGAAVTVE